MDIFNRWWKQLEDILLTSDKEIYRLYNAANPFIDPNIVDETDGTIDLMEELSSALEAISKTFHG